MKILKCVLIQLIILFIFTAIFSPVVIYIDDNKNIDNVPSNSQTQQVPFIGTNPRIDNINYPSTRSKTSRNGWIDSFDNDSYIEFQESINISDSDVKLNSTDLFLITTTADFDAGNKYNVETNSDNPSVPTGELHIVANNTVFIEGFEGVDELDLDIYDSNWVVTKEVTSTNASAKIDTSQQNSGSSSVRFYATDHTNRVRAIRNIEEYTTITIYCRAGGPSNPRLFIQGLNGDTVITSFMFNGAFNIIYYDGGIKTDTGYDYTFNVWYKIKIILDFTNQQYDEYIDGGSFNNYLIVDDANFRNPATSANRIRIGNTDGWSEPVDPDSYAWYDDLKFEKFQPSGVWESTPQTIPSNQQMVNTTITYSGLASGVSEIDKIEWLVDNVVKAAYETDINNNALSPFTIFEDDLTFGTFTDIDNDFTIRIYLTSDGVKTPMIKQLEGSAIYTNGTLTSKPITIPTNNVWDKLTISKTEPSDTSINVSVLNGTTTQPIPGFSERTGTSIDLTTIDTLKHTKIKLLANLSSESLNSPLLHNWSLFWKPDPPRLTSNIPSDRAFPEDTDADNLINLGNYFDDVWTPDDRLLFEIIYESDDTHIDASIDGIFLDFTTPTINWSGSETFRLKCTDEGGLSVNSNVFKVTVTEVNDPPVWTPIDDIYIDEDSSRTDLVGLDEYIYDCDDVIGNITYYLISNDNPTNILIEIIDRTVFAEPLVENYVGEAIIKLNANDGLAGSNTSFLVIITPVNDPPTVELLSPVNNSIITTTTVKLTWTIGFDVDSAIESYDVYLDDVNPPQTLASNDQTVTSFSIDIEDGTYYWTVIPYDGIDEGYWDPNNIWAFTVAIYTEPPIPPPAITLTSPYNNTIINSTSIELIWNGNTSYDDLQYFVYFGTEPAVNEIIASEFTDTKLMWSDLEDGVTYSWSVIPISGQVMGICKDGIWSFTVQLDFIPYYKVEIKGIEYLKMNQSDQKYCNLTVTNMGNVRDIYIPELDAGAINQYIKIINLKNIMLDPSEPSILQILISLPEDVKAGNYNITVMVSSYWGGKTINDTHMIKLTVEPKPIEKLQSAVEEIRLIDIIIWVSLVIFIIIILIAIAITLMARKRKMEYALAAEGITKLGADNVLLPDIVSSPYETPQLGAAVGGGVATAVIPTLQSAISTVAQPTPIPQMTQPVAVPQLPQAQPVVATSKDELSKEERLDLLEEQLLKGEIDLNAYKEFRKKYETGEKSWIQQAPSRLPPASSEPPSPEIQPEQLPQEAPSQVPQVEEQPMEQPHHSHSRHLKYNRKLKRRSPLWSNRQRYSNSRCPKLKIIRSKIPNPKKVRKSG
ncbi:MAG: hypothetical protein KAJ51_05845 [Thermoplasmata archaeon]|nr:hypothetical protein [Thermoplasmata archaeon]